MRKTINRKRNCKVNRKRERKKSYIEEDTEREKRGRLWMLNKRRKEWRNERRDERGKETRGDANKRGAREGEAGKGKDLNGGRKWGS